MTIADRIELALKFIATVIAAFGIWKYFAERDATEFADAQARALTYIERFGDPSHVEAREKLLSYWRGYPEFVAYVRENKITERAFRNFVETTYPNHQDRAAVDNALFRMQVYFDEAIYCREAGICNQEIMDAFLCSYVTRFARIYGPFYARLSRDIGAERIDFRIQDYSRKCIQPPK